MSHQGGVVFLACWLVGLVPCVWGQGTDPGAPGPSEPVEQNSGRPGVARLIRGPTSQALEIGEDVASAIPKVLKGVAGWASLNHRLTAEAERVLYRLAQPEELEVKPHDSLDEVAVKTTLKNLPLILWVNRMSTNLLFLRKRTALDVEGRIMAPNSEEYRRWLDGQIKGLEGPTRQVTIQEPIEARSMMLSISAGMPEMESAGQEAADALNGPRTVVFTATATLSPARTWNGQAWGRWGTLTLDKFKLSVTLPKDPRREALFRDQLYDTKVTHGFGLEPVDHMFWPATPLREQYPLLDAVADLGDQACFEALQRASARGDAEAEFLLGRAYALGEGTGVDMAMADQWWEKSAQQEYPPAVCAVAEACLSGRGRALDTKRGQAHLEKAVALGNPRAMTLLGEREVRGECARQSGPSGWERIRRAAAEGDPEGLLALGNRHLTGTGAVRDPARGERLLQAAAMRGYPTAFVSLGKYYLSKNQKDEAWLWFYFAAKYPKHMWLSPENQQAVKRLGIQGILSLRQEMSPSALEAARREAVTKEAAYRALWMR